MTKFSENEFKEKLMNAQKAFNSFETIELKGRKHIQEAILGCYDIYLHYNEKLIRRRCKKADISYKLKKPMKMILMLAMGVSDDCDDERIKARIRTYVRVLKRFDFLGYELDEAKENLNKFGVDYFANPRSKEQSEEEEKEDDEKQLEFNFDDEILDDNDFDNDGENDDDDKGIDDEEETEDDKEIDNGERINDEDDGEEEADGNKEDRENEEEEEKSNKSYSLKTVKISLSSKIINFLRKNKIEEKNYVIWVTENEAFKCVDPRLLTKLKSFDLSKLS